MSRPEHLNCVNTVEGIRAIKAEIQAELRTIAILMDGGCIYRFYPERYERQEKEREENRRQEEDMMRQDEERWRQEEAQKQEDLQEELKD